MKTIQPKLIYDNLVDSIHDLPLHMDKIVVKLLISVRYRSYEGAHNEY